MFKKSDHSKKKLYETALGLFASAGFEKTTMRDIAKKAGVAPGTIYYYFDSKESLIQEYYQQLHVDHEKLLEGFFDIEKSFEKRLHHVVTSKIQIALPHQDMARALYRVAGHPDSSLSPFSEGSKELRLKSLALFEMLVEGSKDSFHKEVKKYLPKYLWLYQMGVILFWIYDRSAKSKKTFDFIDKTVPLIAWLNDLIQSTLAAPFRKKIIQVIKNFEPDMN